MASSNVEEKDEIQSSSNLATENFEENIDKNNKIQTPTSSVNSLSSKTSYKYNHSRNSYTTRKYRDESKNYNSSKYYKNSSFESSRKLNHNGNVRSNNNSFNQNVNANNKQYNKSYKKDDLNYHGSVAKSHKKSEHEGDSHKSNIRSSSCESDHNNAAGITMGSVVNGRYVRNVPSSSQYAISSDPSSESNTKSSSSNHSIVNDENGQKSVGRTNKNHYRHNYNFSNQNETHGNSYNKSINYYHKGANQNHKSYYQSNPVKNIQTDVSNLKDDANNFKRNLETSVPKGNMTQRDTLIQQLEKGECECMVCCELIRSRDQIWSCSSCYHVFHLRCIKKWARSVTSVVQDCGWRCPACQNLCEKVPYTSYCFCGKSKEPEPNRHYLPHSCGEVCGKQREDKNCNHRCTLLCHPGPCPSCSATAKRFCACGKSSKVMPCIQSVIFNCDSICGRLLNCECHTCPDRCHLGDCKPCSINVEQTCYCSKNKREVVCSASTAGIISYCCDMICGKKLHCGFHECTVVCHKDSCAPCNLLPSIVNVCPCGKTPLKELYNSGKAKERTSCNDPIPVCETKCEKVLLCGPKGNPHKCSNLCHADACPPCPLQTSIKCQCGFTSKEILCADISNAQLFQCEKRCNRRKDCGRHKCLNVCCTNTEHRCELICNKKLSCGNHQCQETCHAGKCPVCWNVSFDELHCHCGQNVLYPPIHCGTKPPECDKPCARTHPCSHEVQHSCHSELVCPPCTIFTTKWCFGKHERHSHIPCFLDGISCGKLCNKAVPCGRHKCQEICHMGPCLKENSQCTQACEEERSCGHPCAAPCHDGECPNTSCKAEITVSCPCGNRTEISTCSDDNNSYRLMSVSILATKMQDIKAGESVNINDLLGKKNKNNRLQCNEECAVLERNKRLAVALQIQNPELSCKPGPPTYSTFLKDEAKKNPKFVSNVYDKFVELVQLAKQSKQKSRSHAFPPMNRNNRRIIHELAEFFGCETQSYDEEPVKNVVITAFRNKSWLPFANLLTVAQREQERELGLRKGPSPLISQNITKASSDTPHATTATSEKKEKAIDYFDFPG